MNSQTDSLHVSRPPTEVTAKAKRRRFTAEFKRRILKEVVEASSVLSSVVKVCTRPISSSGDVLAMQASSRASRRDSPVGAGRRQEQRELLVSGVTSIAPQVGIVAACVMLAVARAVPKSLSTNRTKIRTVKLRVTSR